MVSILQLIKLIINDNANSVLVFLINAILISLIYCINNKYHIKMSNKAKAVFLILDYT